VGNAVELTNRLLEDGISFAEVSKSGINMTELVAQLILRGTSIVNGIEKMFATIEGSCSLILLHEDGLYAARDKKGSTPLVIGQRENSFAVSSESCAFPNLGFEPIKYMEPGEILLLTESGLIEKRAGNGEKQICSFLWIYSGFPASSYEGINVEVVRENSGRALAKRDHDIQVDFVAGVPDSGIAHAIGYSMESGKPYRRPLVKYTPGYGRSYIPPNQETRDFIATMKLIPIKEIIKGNRIVVCEDSIVRGTQLKNSTVRKLWKAGAKEIHVRPACPPLMFPCCFNLSTRKTYELVARRAIRSLEGKEVQDLSPYLDPSTSKYQQMVNWIARDIDVTTLRYQHLDDLVQAIGLPREKLCLYCWNGQCPKSKEKVLGGVNEASSSLRVLAANE
ncbi:MAG: amidophosphoribosyltransferase, partial [SAR324 cluster bacterium]|nr:amidophosphoribosyltransferase [SAR324 cluster bacterium]